MITAYDTLNVVPMSGPAAMSGPMFDAAAQIVKWAAIECDRARGGGSAYLGRFPDLSGPTRVHAPMVADVADAMRSKLRAVT